jgi:hypothetical protein
VSSRLFVTHNEIWNPTRQFGEYGKVRKKGQVSKTMKKRREEDIKQQKVPFSSVGTAKARAERENDLESSEGTARGRLDGTTTRSVRDVVEIVRESLETPRTAWRARRLLIVGFEERVVGEEGRFVLFSRFFHLYHQKSSISTLLNIVWNMKKSRFYLWEIRT